MYRPEGMEENPYKALEYMPDGKLISLAYEAGADAYEEGLKKDGVYTYGDHTPDIEDAPKVSGYWCFIPEEVKE